MFEWLLYAVMERKAEKGREREHPFVFTYEAFDAMKSLHTVKRKLMPFERFLQWNRWYDSAVAWSDAVKTFNCVFNRTKPISFFISRIRSYRFEYITHSLLNEHLIENRVAFKSSFDKQIRRIETLKAKKHCRTGRKKWRNFRNVIKICSIRFLLMKLILFAVKNWNGNMALAIRIGESNAILQKKLKFKCLKCDYANFKYTHTHTPYRLYLFWTKKI